MAEAGAPGARLFMPYKPHLGFDAMRKLGFELTGAEDVRYPLMRQSRKPRHAMDAWHFFRLI